MSCGRLYVIATPIGNLEDLGHRAARILGEVDILAAEDTRSVAAILRRYSIRARKIVSLFAGNEAQRTAELVEAIRGGASVAVVSEAGTPAISDPGQRIVAAAASAGLALEVVPGPSAVIAALVGSGLPTDHFYFAGFPPRTGGDRAALFAALRALPATLVFFEAPDRVAATLSDLADALGGDRPAVVAREMSKIHEEYVRGTLCQLADRYRDAPPRGEVTLVVGGADPRAPAEPVDIEAEVRALLEQGLGPKDIAARLLVTTGKPRRQLYQLALSLRRQRDP